MDNTIGMDRANLYDVRARLIACVAVLNVIHQMGDKDQAAACEAMYGAYSLLDSIVRDFGADIDSADMEAEG